MLAKLRPRSVYDVAAALSLFIALGGTAYAVAANSVGTTQLKDGAVTNPKLAGNSIGSGKIIDRSVTYADLTGALRTKLADRCPANMTVLGQHGVCITTASQGSRDWIDAARDCAAHGYRLPSVGELFIAAAQGQVLAEDVAYWTDEPYHEQQPFEERALAAGRFEPSVGVGVTFPYVVEYARDATVDYVCATNATNSS